MVSNPGGTGRVPTWYWFLMMGLVAGAYFAGREHVKYEIRSGLEDAFSGFQGALWGEEDGTEDSTEALLAALGEIQEAAEPPCIEFGEPDVSEATEIRVIGASMGKVSLVSETLFGEESLSESTEEQLAIVIEVVNLHDRKQIRFDSDSIFSVFRLEDDVGNDVRGVRFGSRSVNGAYDGMIDPETTIQHTEAFCLPLPKTEHLRLTVDKSMLGLDGDDVVFRIPVGVIENWQAQ